MNPIKQFNVPCGDCRGGGRLCDPHFINAVRVLSGLDPMHKVRVTADVVCSACGEYGHDRRSKSCPARRGADA